MTSSYLARRSPASALLLTLLILAAVGSLVLSTTRFALEGQRAASSFDDRSQSVAQARAALNEGVSRIKNGSLDSNGEFGTVKDTGRPSPQYHGYKAGCTDLAPESAAVGDGFDASCPYYSLSIHTLIKADPGQPALSDSDLPLSSSVYLSFLGSVAGVSLTMPVNALHVQCLSGCAAQDYTLPNQSIILSGASVQLTRISGTTSYSGITASTQNTASMVFSRRNSSDSSAKPYSCIDAVGYAGATQTNLRVSVDPAGTETVLPGLTCADRLESRTISTAASSGPIGTYSFENNLNDGSGNGRNGTMVAGASSYGGGVAGSGISLSGQCVSMGGRAGPQSGGTFSLWVNPNDLTQTTVPLGMYDDSNAYLQLIFGGSSVYIRLIQSKDSIFLGRASGSILQAHAWQLVTVSWPQALSTSDQIKVYLNGQEVATTDASLNPGSFSQPYAGTVNLTVGAQGPFGGACGNPFMGGIDEVNLFDTQKSQSFISTVLYGQHAQACAANCLAYWKFDEGSGSTTADSSGNGHAGTLSGTPSWQPGSLGFDGSDNYVAVAYPEVVAHQPNSSVEAWVNVAGAGESGIIYEENISWGAVWAVKIEGGRAEFDIWINGVWHSAVGATAVSPGWNHIAATLSDTNGMKVYLNGQQDGSDPNAQAMSGVLAGNDTITNSVIGRIENNGGSDYFNGSMDDLRIYGSTLSAAAIHQDFQTGKP